MPLAPATARRLLAILLLAALVIRLAWGLSRSTDEASIAVLPDQQGYLQLGRNLLNGQGLSFVDQRFGQRLYATRTPGYPVLIAACGGSVRAVRAVQAWLDTSTALAVYLLARRLAKRELPALVAAALVAFNPFLVYFSALLLTETSYTAALAWAMVLMLSRWRGWMPLAGVILLAVATLIRPPGVGLPVLLAVGAVFVRMTPSVSPALPPVRSNARGVALAGAVALLVSFLALLPWAWRNHLVVGRWVWSTSNDGITLYDGFHPGATGNSDMRFLATMPEARAMAELERSDYFAAKAKQAIRKDPGRLVGLTLRKVARTWSPVPLSEEFGRPAYRLVALAFTLPFDVLVIVGIFRGGMRRAAVLFVLTPALYFTALHALSVGSLRYRVPAEPPLALLAGVGAASFLRSDETEKERTAPS